MTKKRSAKRALLMSALSLLLCVSMLVGTTFAWFTDSVTSANNIIKSGNLDIVLEYWDGDSWEDVSGKSDILTNTLWEPGVTEVAYLRVANAGSLALKYQLGINIIDEVAGVNVDGKSFKLSDYLQFGVIEGVNGENAAYADRESAVAAVKGAKALKAGFTKASAMEPEDELYMALVIYMPTTVGNEANHNGTDVPMINLGINVVATQVAYEEDSFDKYYDGATPWYGDVYTAWYNTTDTEFVIGTAEELAGLAQLVNNGTDTFAGKTIKLASNIDLNDLEWAPIGNWDNAFEGTFDGRGYAICNLSINAPEGEGVGLFGVVAESTIENVTLYNVDINAYSMVAGLVGAAYPATISNCHIKGDVEIVAEWAYVAGIAGYCYYGTQVDDCSVVAEGTGLIQSETRNAVGGITAWLLEGDHKVTDCQVENLNLVGWTNVGGITGFVHYNNTISGCSVKNVTLTKTRVDGNPGIGLIAGGWSYSASNAITLKNNTVNGATLNGNHVAYAAYNVLYGSEYGGATTANFVLESNVTDNITNNLIEVVKASSVQDLEAALAGGNDVVMANDVTLTGKVITTNGITEAYGNKVGVAQYGGTLDGNGKSLTETGTNAYVIVTHGGTIKNIKIVGGGRGIVIYAPTEDVIIDNVVIDSPGYAINTAEHNGQDLIVTNSTIKGWTSLAGLDSVSFTGCLFGENSTKYWQNYGYGADYDRLIRPYGQASFTDCTFEKNFYIDLSSLANGNTVTLTDCICEGVVLTAENYANYITVELPNWATSIADCIVFN